MTREWLATAPSKAEAKQLIRELKAKAKAPPALPLAALPTQVRTDLSAGGG